MKDILDTFINTALYLLLCGMALYAILSFAAYTVSADEALTPDERIVTLTILGEARGEGKQGMYAVACVIKQRMNSKHWPDTASKVCLEKGQFDFWTKHKSVTWDDNHRALVQRLMRHDIETVRHAKMLAININKLDLEWSKHADHYCTLQKNNYWTQGNKPVLIIKRHKFYRLK